jgi:hypothetical protein
MALNLRLAKLAVEKNPTVSGGRSFEVAFQVADEVGELADGSE